MKKFDFWRRKSTRLIVAVSVFLMSLCVLQILRPDREYIFRGNVSFQEGVSVEGYPVYGGIRLPPGVYRVELEYFCDTDMRNLCYVQDHTVFPQGLLTHGTQIYSGLSTTSFHMWLFENADAMEIRINYCGQGSLRTGDLHIYETNQLWGMYLTTVLFFTILLLSFQYLRLYDRAYPISGENKNVLFALAALALVSSIPWLSGTASVSGADLGYHLHRIEGIRDGILAGQFPVRLEPQWVHGYGYANGIFYCGTLLLFPALLRMIGFPITFSYNCYCVALNIATVLIAYYSFARIFHDKYIGVAGSALYTLSVYRIFKLLFASAVGEASAVTFMPLVIYGFWRVFTEDARCGTYRTGWRSLAVGYAGLLQTHVLSCEITALLTVIFCLVYIKKVFRKEIFRELCKGAMGALLFSMWFLVPFLDYYLREDLHIKHVWARTIQERGLYISQLMANWCETDKISAGVGFILMLGFLVYGALWLGGRLKGTDSRVQKLGGTAWLLGGLLMLMSLEIFPWDSIQRTGRLAASLVSSLQFPNRFLGWGCAFLVVLYCCCLHYFMERKQKHFYLAGMLCMLAGITTSGLYFCDHIARDHSQLELYNIEGMGAGYISGAEYLVQGTEQETLLYRGPVASEGLLVEAYDKGALRAEFTCENTTGEEGYVDLPLLHYYGYKAWAGDGSELTVCKGDNHVVRVLVPSGGNTRITVRFVSPWYWRVAEIISYSGALGILLFPPLFRKMKRSKARRRRDRTLNKERI